MKRWSWLLLVFAFVLCAAPFAQAQPPAQPARLGFGADFALKVDYLHFMDSTIGDAKADNGFLVGVEFYKEVFCPNFFLGIETGWGNASGDLSGTVTYGGFVAVGTLESDVNYVPIEFNAKYVIPLAPNFALALGAGFSINYMDVSVNANGTLNGVPGNVGVDASEWLFGGQFFGELNYKVQNWFFGAGIKYQLTQEETFDFKAENIGTVFSQKLSGDNLRVGAQVGFFF